MTPMLRTSPPPQRHRSATGPRSPPPRLPRGHERGVPEFGSVRRGNGARIISPTEMWRNIAVVLAALGLILGVSLASVWREEARLVDDFTSVTRQRVHASVEVLSARLD